jgi:hypothetical protein
MASLLKTATSVAQVLGGPAASGNISEPTNATLARALVDLNDNVLLQADSGGHLFSPMPQAVPGETLVPTIAAGAGAGTSTGLAVSLASPAKDTLGVISIATGATQGTASSVVATVTFARPFGIAPIARLIPKNAAAAALTGAGACYATGETTTGFQIKVGSTALAASTTYLFAYQVGA